MYRLRISTAPVGHCFHIGPYLLGYLLVVASSSVLPSQERAEREAQERERLANEYRARYQEEQRQKHEAAAQRVAEAKRIQREVRMPEASGSGRKGDEDVSSPSPTPTYIRLIRRQAARVSHSETES